MLHERLRRVLDELGREDEIIFVDDASCDDSWEVIARLAQQDPHVQGIRLMNNSGQARATLCGIKHASGQYVATMDDDLQQYPEDLPKLITALDTCPDVDCAIGEFEQKRHSFYRNIGSRLMYRIYAHAFELPRGIRTSSFRVMRKNVARTLTSYETRNPVLSGLLFSTTKRVVNVPVRHALRQQGQSGYSIAGQISLALDSICSFTNIPLRLITALGITSFALAVLFAGLLLALKLLDRISVPGWTTVVLLILGFSGLIMLSLGIVGEYLVRIIRELSGVPLYIERDRVGGHRE